MSTISLPPKGDPSKKLGSYFTPLKVDAQSIPNMTVKVAEGTFWTATNEHMEYIGGTSPTISPPGSNAKWVLVTVKTTGLLNIVNGVASTTPHLPDASTYKDELPLAAIFVGDTTTAITNDMIYDLRPLWSIPPDSVSQTQLNDFATITYVDNGLATKTSTTGTPSPVFTLNVGGTTLNQAAIVVDRIAGPDVSIRFNEAPAGSPAIPGWEFTNDGVTWNPIGVASGSYYTKTDLDGGALNALYYKRIELEPGGALDTRYYTETEIDAGFAVLSHTHLKAQITDLNPQVETINAIPPTLGDVQLGLNELNDVTILGTTTNAVIKYNGSEYANTILNTNDLSDMAVSSPSPNEVLIWNGSVFINGSVIKANISDLVDTDYVLTAGTNQDVNGIKTFKDGVIIETSLTVTGSNTSIETTELRVTDPYIDLNWGETGAGVGNGTGVAGIKIDRGTGGSPDKPDAIMQWDEQAAQWEFGIVGNTSPVLTGAHTHVSSQISDFAARAATEMAANQLTSMADVNYVTSTTQGQYLRFGITNWENKVFATDVTTELNANDLNQMQDVVYLGSPVLSLGDFLQWNGAAWENHVAIKADISDFTETDYLHITGNETKTGNLIINGDFTIGGGSGTSTIINSESLSVLDNMITINAGETGSGVTGGAAGLHVDRGTWSNAMLYWSEPAGTWMAHYSVSGGSPLNGTLAVGQLSFVGHNHLVNDITDIAVSAHEINALDNIHTNSEIGAVSVSDQILDRITRRGDTMDNIASLEFPGTGNIELSGSGNILFTGTGDISFTGGGEVLGLPATPAATAATSKEYVDTTFVDVTGDTMASTATLIFPGTGNISFTGTGEVLGLPATPAATAASSKEYVDTEVGTVNTALTTHINDAVLHITADQNTFLDGLTLTGGTPLTASDVNQLISISGNVQSLLDLKTDLTAFNAHTGDATIHFTEGSIDHTAITNIGTNSHANIDTHIADATLHFTEGSIVHQNISGAGTNTHANIDTHIADATLHFTEGSIDHTAITNIGTNSHANIDTHIADVAIHFNNIDGLSDVNLSGLTANEVLQYVGGSWTNKNIITFLGDTFVSRAGNVDESITGTKTFSNDVVITGDLTVNGTTTAIDTINLEVTDKNITVNAGYAGATSGSTGSGITAIRNVGTGSPLTGDTAASVVWDDTAGRWKSGLEGTESTIALEAVTIAQPLYDIQTGNGSGSPAQAIYSLGFGVTAPASGRTGIQVFVNGIKQVEGATKAYTVVYTNTSQTVVTFTSGSEPATGADVEFYGFGFIG